MRTRTYGSALLTAIVVFGLAHPAVADGQPWSSSPEAERITFTFLGDRLEVRVLAVPEGELRLMRGDRGMLRVTAHAPDGIPGIGRSGNGTERLDLAVAGSDRGVFLVVVPEDTRVRVLLPDEQILESFDPPVGTAVYRWPDGGGDPDPAAGSGPDSEVDGSS